MNFRARLISLAVLCPDDAHGHMTPMKRAGRPEEIAAMAAFLASDDSSFVYGQCYAVDGGVSSTHPHGRIAL